MKFATFLFFIILIASSCGTPTTGIFAAKSDHEKYAEKIGERLSKTPGGRQWLAASEKAVQDPLKVELPYRQRGLFSGQKPRAMGLQFYSKAGSQLRFKVTKASNDRFSLFADLFHLEGYEQKLKFSADTSRNEFIVDIDQAGDYTLRLQPVLEQGGEYTVSVSIGPSLIYPVTGSKAKAGSFWGDAREGGKRKHEGIDIFAPMKTPVQASADGMITSVKNEGIGGRTIWLRHADRPISIYYAHLDEQFVQAGQYVKKGDIIGTVGNTGNARTTPPHLHFGIYSYKGAIDPLPFVDRTVKDPSPLSMQKLEKYVKLLKKQSANGVSVPANTILVPVAMDSKGMVAEMQGGKLLSLSLNVVKPVKESDVALIPAGASAVMN